MFPIRVAALYRFTRFNDPEALRTPLLRCAEAAGIRGTLLLAHEGINGTIGGSDSGIEAVLAHIRTLPGCAEIEVKEFRHATMPFGRMKVRLKREIVTMGQPDIDPHRSVGHYVKPEEWNALIADPNTILIDTRNDYEIALGTFEGAINPQTRHFRDFPRWFETNREQLLEGKTAPRIAMFCTGGIRCEKATAFVRENGLDDVYHLQGGILKYLEDVPAQNSLWHGTCFVFDERESLDHDLQAHDPTGPDD